MKILRLIDVQSIVECTLGNPCVQVAFLGSIALNLILSIALLTRLPLDLKKASNRKLNISTTTPHSKSNSTTADADILEVNETHSAEDPDQGSGDAVQQQPIEPSRNHGAWHCIGASIAGTRHVDAREPCQDWHRVEYLPNGGLVLAVADGVGSASHSGEGARLVCDLALEYLAHELSIEEVRRDSDYRALIDESFRFAREGLVDVAEESHTPLNEYATTLIVVALTPDASVGAMVGDGMVIIENETRQYSCLLDLPKHEYANQVIPITSQNAMEALQIRILRRPVKSVSIMTDGLLKISCDLKTLRPHPPFFQKMLSLFELEGGDEHKNVALQTLLDHPLINEATDDDKTLVIATKMDVEIQPTADQYSDESVTEFEPEEPE